MGNFLPKKDIPWMQPALVFLNTGRLLWNSKYICFPILTYLPSQQTLAYSWYHIYKHCFCHIQPFCPDLCKFERGTKLYTVTKINKSDWLRIMAILISTWKRYLMRGLKSVIGTGLRIAWSMFLHCILIIISSLAQTGRFGAPKKNLIWGFSSISVPPPSVTYINKRFRNPMCLLAAKEPGGFFAAVFILYLCSHLQ